MRPIAIQAGGRQVEGHRDDQGVPHIVAGNWLDALFGLGYLHAVDRGTQLLFARCVASGTAAGQIADSPELLETDVFFRRIGLHLGLDEEVLGMDPALRSQLDAYCDGVNAGLLATGRSLPMWATGFQPQPWNPRATLLIGKLLSFGGLAVSQLQNERLLLEIIHAGARDEPLRELFAPRLDGVDLELLRHVQMPNQMSDEALELITDLPRLAGSNAWAVAPHRSASGAALLASDPHLEVNRLPAIWYEAVLQWPGQYVMGATLPGCPLFAVARTERLAWGVTYMKGDTIDYFVEDCRRGGATGWMYRRENRWLPFQVRRELIGRKGHEPLQVDILGNPQGNLDASGDELKEGLNLSIAWSGGREARAIGTWLDVVASRSVAEAMDVARDCPQPTLCWVFADSDGHIGLQGCGTFPRRGGGQVGLAPIPAWDPANHWQGTLSKDLLPRIYDPPEGFVATANEEVNPAQGPLLVTQTVTDYRKRRIVERLEELPAATLDDMQSLQYDLVSLQARDLLAVFLPHMPPGPSRERLAAWDLRYGPESVEATLFLKLYRNVMMEVLGHGRAVGWRRMLYLCSRAGYSTMILAAADRLLLKQESRWWMGASKAELIRRASEKLDEEPLLPWSEINNFHFTDRFFGNRQVGRILGFRSRRYPMPGNHATPFQGHVLQTATRESTFAPSYHFVTDLGTHTAWTNLPGGPSESRFSRFYKSDVGRWFAGEYKPLAPSHDPSPSR